MDDAGRPWVLNEAKYGELRQMQPNVALLPWGATEAHNYHLPHGTDNIEAEELASRAAERANQQGAKCVVLPCVPFGIDHSQLGQVATITMRSSTQHAVLNDVAESLVKQDIRRLVVLNFHGGNEFKSMIRDVMLDHAIFIVQVHGFLLAPRKDALMEDPGDHGGEFETSLMMHLRPGWVGDLQTAGNGEATKSALPRLTGTAGVWATRDWESLTKDTGVGNPKAATAEKGKKIMEMLVEELAAVLEELSKAKEGMFPLVIRK